MFNSFRLKFLKLRSQDKNFSDADRQDYQLILSAYQEYIASDRDYWRKFTFMEQN